MAGAHYNLGFALLAQGKLDEAVDEFRDGDPAQARHRRGPSPISASPWTTRASTRRRSSNTARRSGSTLTQPRPTSPSVPLCLLRASSKRRSSSIRAAIRLEPAYAEAHCNLGHSLRQTGRYAEALEELRRGDELGSKRPDWRYPSAEWVRQCERLMRLDTRLKAILRGNDKPRDFAEGLALGQHCYDRAMYAAAARLWAIALSSEPEVAEYRRSQPRYNAACAAVLAGSGKSKDDPPPDEAAKAKLRPQALDWLKAELAAWSKLLDTGKPEDRATVQKTLRHWQKDTDLSSIRDPEALAKLPEAERTEWQALWADVAALLKKAGMT